MAGKGRQLYLHQVEEDDDAGMIILYFFAGRNGQLINSRKFGEEQKTFFRGRPFKILLKFFSLKMYELNGLLYA